MNCDGVKGFLNQIHDRQEPISPIPPVELAYLTGNGYVSNVTKDEYDKGVQEVARLSQLTAQVYAERSQLGQAEATLRQDEGKERSVSFHFEGKEKKDELRGRIQSETEATTKEEDELGTLEANVNSLIQQKSNIDRMVPYDGGYVSLTGLGTLVLNDLNVRDYRVASEEFSDFVGEIKSVYSELRAIADRAKTYVSLIKPRIPELEEDDYLSHPHPDLPDNTVRAPSMLWATAIGLAKLQGDQNAIGNRFIEAFEILQSRDSTLPNKLMASEIVTALGGQEVEELIAAMESIGNQIKHMGVPKELAVGVAATMLAGRKYDRTYPTDRLVQFTKLTKSYDAASILSVMNTPVDALSSSFQQFRSLFTSWGYMTSEDTEIASAFLAIGELGAPEVEVRLKYIVEQLHNYLEYPLVAGAILASIPVFEAHEALDLLEKAVTLLSGYASGLERSELVALAVRMIHGVRNEIVKSIDPTARIAQTPVQFTYPMAPGLFIWYRPVIIAHSYYHATFSGMGGFHPAHSHGVGGFAG
jgi:hypothetical protein